MSLFKIDEMTNNLDEHEYVKRSKGGYKSSLAMQGVGCCALIGGLCLLFLELFIGGLMFAGDSLGTNALILSMQCSDSYAWVNIITMVSYVAIALGVALINYGVIMAGFNWIAMGIGFSAVNTKKSSQNANVNTQLSNSTLSATEKPSDRTTYYMPATSRNPDQYAQSTEYKSGLLSKGGWQCDCGLVHASYVSSCGCSKNKREVLSSKKKQSNN